MARPAYTICEKLKSEDRETNELSLIGVVERIVLGHLVKPGPVSSPPVAGITGPGRPLIAFDAFVLSVWLLEQSDHGETFETQFSMVSPSGTDIPSELPTFTMSKNNDLVLHRVMVRLDGLPAFDEQGVWWMETRIRRAGSESEWARQGFPLIVQFSEDYRPNQSESAEAGLSSGS